MNKVVHRFFITQIIVFVIVFLVTSYFLLIHQNWYRNRMLFQLDYNLSAITVDDVDVNNFVEATSSGYDGVIFRKFSLTNNYLLKQKYRFKFINTGENEILEHKIYIYKDGVYQGSLNIQGVDSKDYYTQYFVSLNNNDTHEYIFVIAYNNIENDSSEGYLDFEIKIERQFKIFD